MSLDNNILDSLDDSTKIIEFLVHELRNQSAGVAKTSERLANIEKDVETLLMLVRDGNGRGSLLDRMSTIEGKCKMREKDDSSNRQAKTAIITSIIAAVGAIAAALIAIF